jgi:hypothetical protein
MGKKNRCTKCGKKMNRNKRYKGLFACLVCELVHTEDDRIITFKSFEENRYNRNFLEKIKL